LPFPIEPIHLEVEESFEIFFEVEDEDLNDFHTIWVFEIVDGVQVEAPSFISVDFDAISLIIKPLSPFQEGYYYLQVRIYDTDSVGEGQTKYHEDFIELYVTYTPPEDFAGVEVNVEEK